MFHRRHRNQATQTPRAREHSFINSSFARRLRVEQLEDRRMLAVFTVSNIDDGGAGSLRDAVGMANGNGEADTILFDPSLSGQTITLAGASIDITDSLIIDATALSDDITIDGNQQSRVFNIDDPESEDENVDVTLAGIAVTGGNSDVFHGGGIRFLSDGLLTLDQSTIHGNHGIAGGGISTETGSLLLINSTVSGNIATGTGRRGSGGGILSGGGDVNLSNSSVSENVSYLGGGGIRVYNGALTLDQSNVTYNSTIHQGGGGIYVLNGALVVTDSTVTGNRAASGRPSGGGGIYTNKSNINLVRSDVSGNSTTGDRSYGGGIKARRGTITITNSSVNFNSTEGAASNGGGIFARDATLLLFESTISGNKTMGTGAHGGGIHAAYTLVTMTDSVLSDNMASFKGGGTHVYKSSLTLENTTVSGNGTVLDRARGGGISGERSSVEVISSSIRNNSTAGSYSHGGGASLTGGTLLLSRSVVHDNSTQGDYSRGGGVYVNSDALTITNSTISGNRAEGSYNRGGGVYSKGTPVTLTRSTLTGNVADWRTGGIYLFGATDQFRLSNSIIARNSDENGMRDLRIFLSDPIEANYSLIGVTTGSRVDEFIGIGNLLNVDPLLGPLSDNGGPTKTHALLPGSTALNAGDPSVPFLPTDFDQRGVGFSRVAYDRIDIGAYEAHVTTSADFDRDGDVDGMDFLTWQRGYGMAGAIRANGNSDDDTDVDNSDFAVWELSYGIIDGENEDGGELGIDPFVDAAMAWGLSSDEDVHLAPPLAVANPQAVWDSVVTALELPASIGSTHTTFLVDDDEQSVADDQSWLVDVLLERMFI